MGHKLCYLKVCSFPVHFYSNEQNICHFREVTYFQDYNLLKTQNFK